MSFRLSAVVALASALAVLACRRGQASEDLTAPPEPPEIAAASAAGPVAFVRHAGPVFLHRSGAAGEYRYPEIFGAGLALLDFDRDDDLDLYLVQSGDPLAAEKDAAEPRDRLFRTDLGERDAAGRRQITFVDITEAAGIRSSGYGMGVATGDFDNDGWIDVYVTNLGSNQLWRNRGDGSFADVTRESGADDRRWSVAASFLDYDRDGWLDLYVGNYVSWSAGTHRRCRSELGLADYCGPQSFRPERHLLLRNRGDGTFEDVSMVSGVGRVEGPALGSVVLDADRDGWLDLFVANDQEPNFLWINQRDGTFREQARELGVAVNADGLAEAGMGAVAEDFDHDGDEDLLSTHLTHQSNTLYLNLGGVFEDGTAYYGLGRATWPFTGFGVVWIDFENDGWLDLAVANGAVNAVPDQVLAGASFPFRERSQLFANREGKRFEEIGAQAGEFATIEHVSRGLAVGDLDLDGDQDLVATNNQGEAEVFLNASVAGRSWVGFRVLLRHGERDALGALVEVRRPGLPPIFRRVRTDGSYASASDPRVHVGLDGTASIEAVRVHWVGGGIEEWRGLSAGSYHPLRQGEGRPLVE